MQLQQTRIDGIGYSRGIFGNLGGKQSSWSSD